MFTNEFDDIGTITTILDDTAEHEDVHLIITADDVYIRQWCDEMDNYDIIRMTPKMFYELQIALGKSEGAFYTGTARKKTQV